MLAFTPSDLPPQQLVVLGIVGLFAGLLGGLLGIGGSILMIPALVLLKKDQHLAQAAAMIVNLFVALPAMLRHLRVGAVRWDVVLRMLPFGILLILVGVETSNVFDGRVLMRVFGLFLVYVIWVNVAKLVARTGEPRRSEQRPGWVESGVVGGIMGFLAGLLGIGGGVIAVPLLQKICRLPLRQCIATSCAAMCLTAGVGAWRKNATLVDHVDSAGEALRLSDSLTIATCLAPTAIVGGLIGAGLTHRISLKWLRIALVAVMAWAAARMLGLL